MAGPVLKNAIEVNGAPVNFVQNNYPIVTLTLALFKFIELDFPAGCTGKGVIYFWGGGSGRL